MWLARTVVAGICALGTWSVAATPAQADLPDGGRAVVDYTQPPGDDFGVVMNDMTWQGRWLLDGVVWDGTLYGSGMRGHYGEIWVLSGTSGGVRLSVDCNYFGGEELAPTIPLDDLLCTFSREGKADVLITVRHEESMLDLQNKPSESGRYHGVVVGLPPQKRIL